MSVFFYRCLLFAVLHLTPALALSPVEIPVPDLASKCNENVCAELRYEQSSEVAYFVNNAVQNLLNYTSLVLSGSKLANLPLNVFVTLPQLDELKAYGCNIEHVVPECFQNAHNLLKLDLGDNRIGHLEDNIFVLAPQLEQLRLSDNQLELLSAQVFTGLKNLRRLNLSNNRLKRLPADIFANLLQLVWVDVEENQLAGLPAGLFGLQHNLEEFFVTNNPLTHIDSNTFQTVKRLSLEDCRELKTLQLSANISELHAPNCGLKSVQLDGYVLNIELDENKMLETLKLAQPQVVQKLSLRFTNLRNLDFLKHASALKDLNLNGIEELPALPDPWPATELKRLTLSQNNLTAWPRHVLSKVPDLTYLDISHNMLREIYVKDFDYFRQYDRFYIDDNDWDCEQLEVLLAEIIIPRNLIVIYDDDITGEYRHGVRCRSPSPPTICSNCNCPLLSAS